MELIWQYEGVPKDGVEVLARVKETLRGRPHVANHILKHYATKTQGIKGWYCDAVDEGIDDEAVMAWAYIEQPKAPPRISELAQRLLDEFAEAAQYHGWQKDQGTGKEVEKAAESYKLCYEAMVALIEALESKSSPELSGVPHTTWREFAKAYARASESKTLTAWRTAANLARNLQQRYGYVTVN